MQGTIVALQDTLCLFSHLDCFKKIAESYFSKRNLGVTAMRVFIHNFCDKSGESNRQKTVNASICIFSKR